MCHVLCDRYVGPESGKSRGMPIPSVFFFFFFKAVISYLLTWIMLNFCIAWFGGRSISGFPHGNGILHQEFQLILFLDKQLMLCSFQLEVKKQALI